MVKATCYACMKDFSAATDKELNLLLDKHFEGKGSDHMYSHIVFGIARIRFGDSGVCISCNTPFKRDFHFYSDPNKCDSCLIGEQDH